MTVALIGQCLPTPTKALPLKKRVAKWKLPVRNAADLCFASPVPTTALPLQSVIDCREQSPQLTMKSCSMVMPPQAEKNKVHFATTSSIRTRQVTAEDLDNSWYDSQHYRSFELENRECIALHDAGVEVEIQGLEHVTGGREKIAQRRMQTLKHNAVVLELYDVQRCCGVFDADLLCRVSQRLSKEPVQRAFDRANYRGRGS